MRRPRNSSSVPRSRHAETLTVNATSRCVRQGPELGDERARLGEIVRGLEGGCGRLAGVEALQVPGIELAQVARGPLGTEVLLRSAHHPEQLRDHVLALGGAIPAVGELLEDPRVAER